MIQKKQHQPVFLKEYQVPDYLIETVHLEFDLGEETTLVKSQLSVQRNPAKEKVANELVLVGEELALKSIHLDGKSLDLLQYRINENSLIVYNVPEQFSLEIITEIKPQLNTQLMGLYKSSGNFCTQCEAEGFRRITYFLDRPDVMARYTTTIIADETRYPILLSNGNPIAQGKYDNGKHWIRWEDPFKKPCYLFALVAGDFEFVEDFFITKSGRQITLRIYVEKGQKDKCAHAMASVKKAMRWDEDKFKREYDLDIYMIVAVSDFNMGAMENKGLNIFNNKYILAKPQTATDEDYIHVESVIAHEYFHNWTGNRITCRDWFQLSLKEGLTIFRDQSFTADTTSPIVARIHNVNELRVGQFPEDAGPLAHPVRPESYLEINNFYTSTIYNKGAEVIRMMQTILGPELFQKGMQFYFEHYDGEAVTIEEFVHSMEMASQLDLHQFRLWYSQIGTPLLEVSEAYDAKQGIYKLTIKQNQQPPLHIPVNIGLLDASGKELFATCLQITKTIETFEFKNLAAKPLPSLLRNFSAPVKIVYPYSDADLQLLFKFDTDLFNRWEAGQKYALSLIARLIKDFRANKTLIMDEGLIDGFKNALTTLHQDKLYLAEFLILPSEKYIAEQMTIVDVDAIHAVREFLLDQIAGALQQTFLKLYHENNNAGEYLFDMTAMGKRRLKNLCLFYLMRLPEKELQQLGIAQLQQSLTQNMTDAIAALRALANTETPAREIALKDFYETWQDEALVVDKWLMIQAESKLPKTLAVVKGLLQHPAFDLKNPNKVYSLIAAFCHRNPVNFHRIDGAGYELLANIGLELDKLNPSIASRILKPLTDWRRYDSTRQILMKEQLEKILAEKSLSRDTYEIVAKSLEKF